MTTPVKEVKVFNPDDFTDWPSRLDLANRANKILNEKLVKYYGSDTGSAEDGLVFDTRCVYDPKVDTHILLGFEPEPIIKEKVNLKVHIYRDENGSFLSEIADEQVGVMGGYKYVETVSIELKEPL